jgi:glycogen synthase
VKCLLLTNEYPPNVYGGAGVHVEFLARELARLMDVEVRCFGQQDETSGSLRVRGYLPPASFDEAASDVRSVLATFGRDLAFAGTPSDTSLVHCHTWYTHLAGLLLKQAYGLPLVITTHSLEPLRPWKQEQIGRGYHLSSWVERTALEAADAIIAVSKETKADVERLFDVSPDRVRVIYNGVDTELYRRTVDTSSVGALGVDVSRPYVLFVGRITRQKGLRYLIDAIPFLDPDTQVILCAGAADTPEIEQETEQAIARVQATRSGVVWIPETLRREVLVRLYSLAAVFCCPSIYEPFGIINLEAMACETAVVASAVGGIPEVVVPGETGLLVPVGEQDAQTFEPRDPQAFSRALAGGINRLVKDSALRRQMGVAGRRRVEEHFSWPAVARQTHALYTLLADHPHS